MQIYVSPANQRRQRSAHCPVSPTHFPNVSLSLLRHCHINPPPNTNKSHAACHDLCAEFIELNQYNPSEYGGSIQSFYNILLII